MRTLLIGLICSLTMGAAHFQSAPIRLAPGTVEGFLTPDSPKLPDYPAPYACYSLETEAGQTWEIDVSALDYPIDLAVGRDETCLAVYENIYDNINGDDTETGFPVLNFTTHVGGTYLIVISAAETDAKGPFTLTARQAPAP